MSHLVTASALFFSANTSKTLVTLSLSEFKLSDLWKSRYSSSKNYTKFGGLRVIRELYNGCCGIDLWTRFSRSCVSRWRGIWYLLHCSITSRKHVSANVYKWTAWCRFIHCLHTTDRTPAQRGGAHITTRYIVIVFLVLTIQLQSPSELPKDASRVHIFFYCLLEHRFFCSLLSSKLAETEVLESGRNHPRTT